MLIPNAIKMFLVLMFNRFNSNNQKDILKANLLIFIYYDGKILKYSKNKYNVLEYKILKIN